MKYRRFGSTDLTVSELGMGCSGLGGGLHHDDRREALATLWRALDAGVNFFDTSDTYSQGGSERIIGQAFQERRGQVILATKVGFVYSALGRAALRLRPLFRPIKNLLRPARASLNRVRYSQKSVDYSAGHVVEGLHRSLQRLRTDYLDLYQLHNPPPEVIRQGACFEAFERLKTQGKIRYYGVSCAEVDDALWCFEHSGVSSVQVAVSLLDQQATASILPRAAKQGIGVIARVPLAQGLLAERQPDSKAEQVVKRQAVLAHRKRRTEAFRFLSTGGRTMPQAALQFVLGLAGVSVVIPGMSRRDHLEENLAALAAPPLSAEELARVERLGRERLLLELADAA